VDCARVFGGRVLLLPGGRPAVAAAGGRHDRRVGRCGHFRRRSRSAAFVRRPEQAVVHDVWGQLEQQERDR